MMPVSWLREEFAALVRDGARCALGRGALEIARIAYPDLQPDRYLAEFDELAERLGALHGGRELRELPREALRTAPTPDILARMLRNLLRVYLSRDDPPHALATVDLLLVLVPDSPDDLRTRGCLYEHLDCV